MKVILLKVGTRSVWHNDWLKETMVAVHSLMEHGYKVLVISSGAIEAGTRSLLAAGSLSRAEVKRKYDAPTLAGIGTLPLFTAWQDMCTPYGLHVVPLLTTHNNLSDPHEAKSIQERITSIYTHDDALLIANENDLVSSREITYWRVGLGENDKLQVAFATLLQHMNDVEIIAALFATHTGGYYNENPETNLDAILIPELSWEEYGHQDWVMHFMFPDLDKHCVITNNVEAKVCAGMVCAKFMDIPHVGISRPQEVANLVLQPEKFSGTRIVA